MHQEIEVQEGCFLSLINLVNKTPLDETCSDLASARIFLLQTRNSISGIKNNLRDALNTLAILKKNDVGKTHNLQNEMIRLQVAFSALDIEQNIDEDI